VKQVATLDSSFWINADRVGLLPVVLAAYDLHYAPAVSREMDPRFPSGREFWRLVHAGALTELAPLAEPVQEFGPGERAALNLALEHRDWILLMDDHRPFQEATRLGLWVLCTPVLVIALFGTRQLNAEQALTSLAGLAALQTVSPHLLAAALAQLGRSFSRRGGT
jgi:predicted nucleic acid-binding protein